ncbi:Kazal domain [Trinorchestia longiramus]|nr:Kazal domain [Trinorchestia longiramus]
MVDEYGIASCRCNLFCPPVVTPVCGTDGLTYHSDCHLVQHACVTQTNVTVAYVGPCGSSSGCEDQQCQKGAVCVQRRGRASCHCLPCPGHYQPVCGSDQRTYRSSCLLQRQACLSLSSSLSLLHPGPCDWGPCSYQSPCFLADPCRGVQCGEVGVCTVSPWGEGVCSCPTDCPKVQGEEVCGSDHQTYNSLCLLQVAACTSKQDIKVAFRGSCDTCAGVVCQHGARCERGACVCPTDCPPQLLPVCGTDGTTYTSECTMRQVSVCGTDGTTYTSECTMRQVSVCGTDGTTYTSECTMRQVSVCGTDGTTYTSECTMRQVSVCGTDGTTYTSECTMRQVSVCGTDGTTYTSECTMRQVSVCGTDGATYTSECTMRQCYPTLAVGEIYLVLTPVSWPTPPFTLTSSVGGVLNRPAHTTSCVVAIAHGKPPHQNSQ